MFTDVTISHIDRPILAQAQVFHGWTGTGILLAPNTLYVENVPIDW